MCYIGWDYLILYWSVSIFSLESFYITGNFIKTTPYYKSQHFNMVFGAISPGLQREIDTSHFMQTAPWLGMLPGADGQVLHSQDGGDSPIVSLFKSATAAIVSSPGCPNPVSFNMLSKQAEAAGNMLHKTYVHGLLSYC